MLTNGEMIVSLWFVPVVLCILVPLATLCIWLTARFFRTMVDKVAQVEKIVVPIEGGARFRTAQPQSLS